MAKNLDLPPRRQTGIYIPHICHTFTRCIYKHHREGEEGRGGGDRETNLPKCPDDGLNVQGGKLPSTTSTHNGDAFKIKKYHKYVVDVNTTRVSTKQEWKGVHFVDVIYGGP